MNRISSEIRDSLKEFRDDHDNIRKLLSRPYQKGPAWAIKNFRVLKVLHDSETDGLTGEEFESAKQRVFNIINYDVFKYVEDKYMVDENDQVALRSAGAVILRPTNNQQQRPLSRPNPVPRVPVPIPFPSVPFYTGPITVNTGPIYTGTINNTKTVNHHHSVADQKEMKRINKNLGDIREEQMRQGKEIGDLKSSHNDLRTTVHTTLKKKPLRKHSTPDSGKKLFVGDDDDDGTPCKANSFVEDTVDEEERANLQATYDFVNRLANDSCRSPSSIARNNVAEAKEANSGIGDRLEAFQVQEVIRASGGTNNAPASWCSHLFPTNSTVGPNITFNNVADAKEQESIAAPAPWSSNVLEDATNDAGEQQNKENAAGNNRQVVHRSKKKVQRTVPSTKNPNVNSIVLLGESEERAKYLRNDVQFWDFLHLDSILEELGENHPEKDFYLFQAPTFVLDQESRDKGGLKACPTLAVILVPHGEKPPEFVMKHDPEMLTYELVSFEDFGLEWKTFSSRRYGEKVFALKRVFRKLNVDDLEKVKLWTLQGDELKRKPNGELDLQWAVFEFNLPNGETIRETYRKGFSTYSNICKHHGLVKKDELGKPILNEDEEEVYDEESFKRVKAKVQRSFRDARTEREEQITMLNLDYPSHATHSVVKVFPQNEVVLDFFRDLARTHDALVSNTKFQFAPEKRAEMANTSPFPQLGYINEWYGRAETVFPNPMEVLRRNI